MIDKLATAGVIVGASASAASVTGATPAPIAIIATVAVACLAACFARFVVIFGPTSRKKKEWRYELAVILLCVLLSGALAYDHSWSVGEAASYGGGIGFIGAGLKPILENMFRLVANAAIAAYQNSQSP